MTGKAYISSSKSGEAYPESTETFAAWDVPGFMFCVVFCAE